MSTNNIIIMTGATSGMGLIIAGKLLGREGTELIVGARSPKLATALNALGKGGNLTVFPLDLSSMVSVSEFAKNVRSHLGDSRKIATLVCNAGLQIITPKRMTADGFEETFATNHLGHFLLTQSLLPNLKEGALVTSTASGTHNPDELLATRAGFQGAVFKNARAVSLGDVGTERSVVEQGMDRYATSKLCNILFVKSMAQHIPASQAKFIAFDPGLMPGTGLARERPAFVRFVWKYVLPRLGGIVKGMSSPGRSAQAMVDIITETQSRIGSGEYIEFTGEPAPQSEEAKSQTLADDLFKVSSELIEKYLK